jgi:hypothetical protein
MAGKFNKPAAGARPPAKKKSRYGGIKAAAPKDPIPHMGTYRFRVAGIEEGYNEGKSTTSYKVSLELVLLDDRAEKHHSVGDTVVIPWVVDGAKNAQTNRGRVKAFVINAGGFESEEEYDSFDADGEFIDATTGVENAFSAYTLIGRLVDAEVKRGNDVIDSKTNTPTGDYYREYAWEVVDDEDQDQTPRVLAQAEAAAE